MSDPVITCPKCDHRIHLTESLAAPLVAAKLAEERTRIAAKMVQERARIAAEEGARAQARVAEQRQVQAEQLKAQIEQFKAQSDQLASLQREFQTRGEKLAEAQKDQAELLRKGRALEEAQRELDLTVEKRVTASLEEVRRQALAQAEDSLKLRVLEKQQTIDAMQRQVEELKRRAEQGSQQLQGEVAELELEADLRARFPHDAIEPVPKGQFGGDCLQAIIAPGGMPCGSILWESKRTKHWTEGWLQKLRDDARSARADVAIIVSVTVPKNVETFALIDGVWVTTPRAALAVAQVLRQSLIDVARARTSVQGRHTKSEMMYQYLTGSEFRHRMQAMVERIIEMQEDLDKERRVMARMWAKRETQVRAIADATAGMYGDLQGIAGKSMEEIDGLDVKMLDA